jgi:hypothetical protein
VRRSASRSRPRRSPGRDPRQRKSHHRRAPSRQNQRLAATGYIWAFAALTASPGARAHYDRRKAAGDRHIAAQRNLFNRLIGICTTAYSVSDTTKRPPSQPPQSRPPPWLDTLGAWDVFIALIHRQFLGSRCPPPHVCEPDTICKARPRLDCGSALAQFLYSGPPMTG